MMAETPRMTDTDPFLKGINRMWNEGAYSDVTIKVGDQTYQCHRVVLAAISDYFHAMFSSGMKESNEGNVNLEGIDNQTFQDTLQFIYQGPNPVTTDNAVKILQAAVRLQIISLQEHCESLLDTELNLENCVGFWKLATQYNCSHLQKSSLNYTTSHFSKIANSVDFLSLDEKSIIDVIQQDALNIESEEMVYEAVMNWITLNDCKNKQLEDVFSYIRLRFTSIEFLDKILENPIIKDSIPCQQMVEEARCCIMMPKTNEPSTENKRIRHNRPRCEKVLCVIGARSREPNPSRTDLTCFSFGHNSQFQLVSLPFEPGAGFSVCSDDINIYLSGGYIGHERFAGYDGAMNSWVEMQSMHNGRWCHTMVMIGNDIFALGGYDSSTSSSACLVSIEKYNMFEGSWKLDGELLSAVAAISAAVLDGKIYIFGGRNGSGDSLANIQSYDVGTKQTTVVAMMPSPSLYTSAVAFNNNVYITCRNGTIVEFSKENNTCSVVCNTDSFDHFNCTIHGGCILIVASKHQSGHYLIFNPVDKSITKISKKLSALLSNIQCTEIFINKSFIRHTTTS